MWQWYARPFMRNLHICRGSNKWYQITLLEFYSIDFNGNMCLLNLGLIEKLRNIWHYLKAKTTQRSPLCSSSVRLHNGVFCLFSLMWILCFPAWIYMLLREYNSGSGGDDDDYHYYYYHGATPSFSVIDYVNSCYQRLLLYIIYSMYLSFILFLFTSIVSQPNREFLLARFVFVD